MAITVKEAQTLYVSYFGRPADFVGLQYWTGTDTIVGSLEQLAHSFYNSAEGKKYFPVDPATNQIDVTASINAIYANMFARVPETAGFDYWYNEIASGKINLAEAAVAIYRGAQGKDALMIENKIAAATQFTDQVAASDKPSLYYGDQAFAKANEFLNTVTDVTDVTSAGFAAQVNAAVNVAEAAGGASSSEGGIFTLTTGINGGLLTTSGILTNEANVGFEVPEGQSKYLTAGNDVVDLSKWNGTGSVNIGDAFSSDNDKVTVMANALAGPVAKDNLELTSIENLEIVNSGVKTTPVILKGANFKGLEVVKLIGDDTNLDVSELTQGVKIDATANADTITGSSKADTINGGAGNDIIKAGSGNDVLTGGNGADTFIVGSVQSLGIDKILDFSAEDKISMNGFVPGELKKFDASTFSTVNYKTLDSVLATFGSGGANETKAGDVVIFSYDGKTYALLSTVTGFKETNGALVDITGANVASLTESNFGESSLYTYKNYTDFTTAIAKGERIPDGEAIIKTMTVDNAGALALNNDYLAKVANGGIKAITGNGPITITMDNIDGASLFDASKFEAKLFDGAVPADVNMNMNIDGTSAKDEIIASKFGGTIDSKGGKDVITLGAGNSDDKVVVKVAGTSYADVATIANFKAGGTDVIALGTTNTKAATSITNITSEVNKGSYSKVEDVLSALGTASAFTAGLANVDYFVWNGDTYIVDATASNSFSTSTDYLVKLTGTGYNLAEADILANT